MLKCLSGLATAVLFVARTNGASVTFTEYNNSACTHRATECGPGDVNKPLVGDCRDGTPQNNLVDETEIPPFTIHYSEDTCTAVPAANIWPGMPTTSYVKMPCKTGTVGSARWNATYFSDSSCSTAITASTIEGAIVAERNTYYTRNFGAGGVPGVSSTFATLLAAGGSTSGICVQYSSASAGVRSVISTHFQNLPAPYTSLPATVAGNAADTVIPLIPQEYGYYKIEWSCTAPTSAPSTAPAPTSASGSAVTTVGATIALVTIAVSLL